MLKVEKIESGTVIDHIRAGRGLDVLEILGINSSYQGRVALVMNVPSKRMGKKDIVKIEGKHIDEHTADKIALIAPEATLNIIKNSNVSEKRVLKMPTNFVGILKCLNPKCITNHERADTIFSVEKESGGTFLRCAFCERAFPADELVHEPRA